MSISNIKFKAEDSGAGAAPVANTPPTTDEALQMKAKLEAALDQVKQSEQYDQYLTQGQQAELATDAANLNADLQILNVYLQTGAWTGTTSSAGSTATQQAAMIDMSSVAAGFWVLNPGDTNPTQVLPDANGDITVPNDQVSDGNGGFVKPKVWYVADADVTNITGHTVGNDVILTITHSDGTIENKTFKDGATGRYQICINGLKNTTGMTMNFSHVDIVDPTTGDHKGLVIIGSQGDDTIYGTVGQDNISGAGGSDNIVGMGGNDEVYGYASDDANVNVLGLYSATDLGADGNNTIYDIYGTDNVDDGGPGGQDTVIKGYTTDAQPVAPTHEESDETTQPNDPTSIENWFTNTGFATPTIQNGELVLTTDGSSDSPKIDMDLVAAQAQGYMITGARDGTTNDLILTAVKIDPTGAEPPQYYRIRVKNYFSKDTNIGLKITNSFTDLGELNKTGDGVGTKQVDLEGTGGIGDILVGPKTVFDDYAVGVDGLGQSTDSESDLEDLLKEYQDPATTVWGTDAQVKTNDDGSAYISLDAGKIGSDGKLDIPSDFGAAAFVQKGDDGTWTITVTSNTGYSSTRVVIELTNVDPSNPPTVTLGGSSANVYTVDPTAAGVTIGGNVSDFVAGYQFGSTFSPDDNPLKIKYKNSDHGKGPSTAITGDQLKDKITACTTFEELDKYQDEVDKMQDTDANKASYQTDIDNARLSIINSWIGTNGSGGQLDTLKADLTTGTAAEQTAKDAEQTAKEQALEADIVKVNTEIEKLNKTSSANIYTSVESQWQTELTKLGRDKTGAKTA